MEKGQGRLSRAQLRVRILQVLLEPEGLLLTLSEVARRVGVHRATIARHWAELRLEAQAARERPVIGPAEVGEIERALLAQAKQGSVQAARTLLMRKNLLAPALVPDDGGRLVEEIRQMVERQDDDDTCDDEAGAEAGPA